MALRQGTLRVAAATTMFVLSVRPSVAQDHGVLQGIPAIELTGTFGLGSAMSDESWLGAGPSVGAAIGLRLRRHIAVEFGVDRLRTRRDFVSDVHWREERTRLTGNVLFHFGSSPRVRPFVEGLLGLSRSHRTSTFPTFSLVDGRPTMGLPEVIEERETSGTAGVGVGIKWYPHPLFVIGPGLRLINPVQAIVRVGYVFPGRTADAPSSTKARPTTSVTASFSLLGDRLRPGDRIDVVDAMGQKMEGTISSLSASALTLSMNGVLREFREGSLASIDRHGDSLKNGVLTGMIVGAIVPTVIVFSLCQNGCSNPSDSQAALSYSALFGTLGGGIGAAAGAGIDARRAGRTPVYRAPPTPSRPPASAGAGQGWAAPILAVATRF